MFLYFFLYCEIILWKKMIILFLLELYGYRNMFFVNLSLLIVEFIIFMLDFLLLLDSCCEGIFGWLCIFFIFGEFFFFFLDCCKFVFDDNLLEIKEFFWGVFFESSVFVLVFIKLLEVGEIRFCCFVRLVFWRLLKVICEFIFGR